MKYGRYYPVLLKCHKMTKIYLYCFNQDNPPPSLSFLSITQNWPQVICPWFTKENEWLPTVQI